jgi:hypothetical protein
MVAQFAANRSLIARGKWFFRVDDVLVNGVSTGACAASGFGGCLVFSDTGAPLNLVQSELVDTAQATRLAQWRTAHSLDPAEAIAPCRALRGYPLNLTLRVGGVDFTASAGDMMTEIAGHPQGDGICIDDVQIGPLSSMFGADAVNNPLFEFPAPLAYIGNNFLRNFYVTNTLPDPRSGVGGLVTLGCATGGAGGTCTSVTAAPTPAPTPTSGGSLPGSARNGGDAATKLSAGDGIGIVVAGLVVLGVAAMVGMYWAHGVPHGAKTRDRRLSLDTPLYLEDMDL